MARPFVDKAGATFATVVDQENLLGQLYRFKAVPNGYLIDERGIVEYRRLGGFDIRKPETKQVVADWIEGSGGSLLESPLVDVIGGEHDQANSLFREGLRKYQAGKLEAAMSLWREGMDLEPDNYIIRKQIWAVENPDKFYDGDVDFGWQRQQMEQGR